MRTRRSKNAEYNDLSTAALPLRPYSEGDASRGLTACVALRITVAECKTLLITTYDAEIRMNSCKWQSINYISKLLMYSDTKIVLLEV